MYGTGRALRVFMRLFSAPWVTGCQSRRVTYRTAYNSVKTHDGRARLGAHLPAVRQSLKEIPLRIGGRNSEQLFTSIPENYEPIITSSQVDPQLHPALIDLVYHIRYDLHEACGAFDDPDVYYPGVDDGIEPVPDDHIDLVIWATQRELDRELRQPLGPTQWDGSHVILLPAAPLIDLPQRIKRAFVERRRLRYQQWGIGKKEWENNSWSFWNVPEDPDWVPYWDGAFPPREDQVIQDYMAATGGMMMYG